MKLINILFPLRFYPILMILLTLLLIVPHVSSAVLIEDLNGDGQITGLDGDLNGDGQITGIDGDLNGDGLLTGGDSQIIMTYMGQSYVNDPNTPNISLLLAADVIENYGINIRDYQRWSQIYITYQDTYGTTKVPEPATLILMGIGLLGISAIAIKKKT